MKKRRFFRRAFAIAALTTLASANAFGISTKYFKTDVTAATGGQVYASLDYVKPADTDYGTSKSTGTVTDSVSYVFAKPTTGYGFSHWTLNSGTLSESSFDLTANPAMLVNAGSSTSSSNPATVSLQAVFVSAAVAAVSSNPELGTVSISSASNAVNDQVTLTAIPDTSTFKASVFDGWYLNDEFKSDNLNYTFTISNDNSGIYTAKFTRKAGYFRMRSQVANKYAYVFGDSARQSNSSTEGFSGVVFDGSIAMVPAANLDLTDPGYIVKIDGISDLKNGGLKDLDFTSQGISARDIITEQYSTAIVNAEQSGNYWTFYYEYGGAKRFLKDGTYYPINYAIACGGASDHLWTLEAVNQIPITPIIEDGFSYATSMYTSFPYECGTGVSAWYSTDIEDDLIEVEDGHVPANTAVILRCDGEEGDFYIKPSFEEYDALEDNILEGYICLNGDSLSSAGKLVYAGGETWYSYDGAYLPSNRAFVTVSQNARPFNNTTAIKNLRSNNINNREVFDISGRKLNVDSGALRKGVYIVNGKKRVIK